MSTTPSQDLAELAGLASGGNPARASVLLQRLSAAMASPPMDKQHRALFCAVLNVLAARQQPLTSRTTLNAVEAELWAAADALMGHYGITSHAALQALLTPALRQHEPLKKAA